MRVGVAIFPGSNCDHDAMRAVAVAGHDPVPLWHKDASLQGVDAVILPGGFSYGDYLRCGALSARSTLMAEVRRFAQAGGPVMGICNGFQILCEAHLLPGVLMRNRSLRFQCERVALVVENANTRFTAKLPRHRPLELPIAHADGNYFCGPDDLARLEGEGQVVLRYLRNPNGSVGDIAGIVNDHGNVLGLMPHPERACEAVLGGTDGLGFFQSLLG